MFVFTAAVVRSVSASRSQRKHPTCCRSWATRVTVGDSSMWRGKGSWKPSLCAPTWASSRVWGWAEARPPQPTELDTETHVHKSRVYRLLYATEQTVIRLRLKTRVLPRCVVDITINRHFLLWTLLDKVSTYNRHVFLFANTFTSSDKSLLYFLFLSLT